MAIAVAVPAPLYKTFDYLCTGREAPLPGTRVRVPFGRRRVTGVVAGAPRPISAETRALKAIEAVLDDTPLLPAALLELCEWTAAYYQHPIGEVLATALSGGLRAGRPAQLELPQRLELTAAGRDAIATLPKRSRKQRELLEAIGRGGELPENPAAALRKALQERWAQRVDVPEAALTAPVEAPPALTPEQAAALAELRKARGFGVTLLEGVTGSGKTELYLQRAADVIAHGRQVLVLVPEIGLTPQLAERFTQRFGRGVAACHSAMPDSQRMQAWLGARAGRVSIIVGTRSAVFLPFAQLGLVIVDEEHDPSFKQHEGLRYSARDLAIWRAQQSGAPAILGSATPSLETRHNAQRGRYGHARLTRRIHTVAPPAIRLLDVRNQPLTHGLAASMTEAIGRHLDAGGQALLFINRRGYAPVLLCHACGWQAPCRRCDARMTLHRSRGRLICHHCAAEQAIPAACPDCGSRELVPVGQGTERIEDALRISFPGKRIERFDSDRIRRRGELERLLGDIRSGAIHILVGTQMLAKGHDFARLSLVGILNVDQALYGADFRAPERMGQLITQVAGRAGRATQPGEVLLQTHEPHHPLLQKLLAGGYGALSESLMEQRRDMQLPPFTHLALLRAEAAAAVQALRFLQEARELLGRAPALKLLGPVPAPMEKLAGRYRAQLLLQANARGALQKTLSAWTPALDGLPSARKVRWSLDVDPIDLF